MVSAQIKVRDIDFYGVDFSLAKVYGAKETPEQFKKAYDGINNLFISEPEKYDIAKFFDKDNVDVLLDMVTEKNKQIKDSDVITTSKNYSITEEQIVEQMKSYKLTPKNDLGMIIIAESLNKVTNKGTYIVILFNAQRKEIITTKRIIGKTGGFGLRNFWAGSLYNAFQSLKYE